MGDLHRLHKQEERKARLERVVTHYEGLKLIFEWVKTNQVSVKEMKELLDHNDMIDGDF